MSYSSALLPTHGTPHAPLTERELVDGQVAKYRRVLDELQLRRAAAASSRSAAAGAGSPRSRSRAGHAVDGLTLSTEQLDYARARLARSGGRMGPAPAGLPRGARPVRRHRVDRDVRGGRRGLLAVVLRDPEALPQARRPRLRADHRHRRRAVRSLPRSAPTSSSSTSFRAACCRRRPPSGARPQRAGLAVVNEHAFGHDYARTLATWRERFHAQRRRRARARLRRALRPHLGLLSRLLRSGVRAALAPMSSSTRSLMRSALVALALLVGRARARRRASPRRPRARRRAPGRQRAADLVRPARVRRAPLRAGGRIRRAPLCRTAVRARTDLRPQAAGPRDRRAQRQPRSRSSASAPRRNARAGGRR